MQVVDSAVLADTMTSASSGLREERSQAESRGDR